MRRLVLLLAFVLPIGNLFAADAAAVAKLVLQSDTTSLAEPLTAALADSQPLVRATAARIAAVRDLKPLVAPLREAIARETDSSAAREEIQALALIGSADDVAFAAAASLKLPPGVDDALAIAIARRGGEDALTLYATTLRDRPISNRAEFFRVALWGRSALVPVTGSRILGSRDAAGWRGFLDMLESSDVELPPAILAASLGSEEPLRYATLYRLVRKFAPDPSKLPEPLREPLQTTPAEKSSDREDFARELLRRMLGGERKDDPRWTAWLEGAEADALLSGENAVLIYLTDAEYAIRHNRCRTQTDCRMPDKRPTATTSGYMHMQKVAPPAFDLPDVLPRGLVHEIMRESKCTAAWLGVVTATVDSAGRVQNVPLESLALDSGCRGALDEILHLSFASNTSVASPRTGPVLLVKARKAEPCLDWEVPENVNSARLLRVGGDVKPPLAKRRVEPDFPPVARQQLNEAGGRGSLVILEATITSTGCVRSLRFVGQSPIGAINGAAALALSQWTFVPAYYNGQPVDVLFNLTINFKLN